MKGHNSASYFGIGIVRDKNGKPKFDDIDALPEPFKMAYRRALTVADVAKLTADERRKLGVD